MTDQSGAFPETLREAPNPFNDPENSEYPVVVRAYLAMETALAKRILEDRRRSNAFANTPDNWPSDQRWDDLGQTSHESLWSAARKEAGLPTEGAFKNEVILGAALERPRPAPPEHLAALLCETAPSEEGHSWCLTARPQGPCTAHRSQAARLTGRVFVGSAGTGAAPPDAQAGVELVESSRLPQGIEAAKTGSAVDSAKSPTNSPSYALFDLFSRGAPRPFVGVDQKPDGCWFACIASLTGIPLDDFPDPPTKDTESDVRNVVTKLLHAHGWQLHRLYTIPDAVPRGWAIAGGTSPRNLAHAVVMYDGELVWDPHPSRAGLAAIEEYEVLVPVRAGNALPVRGGAAQPPPSAPDDDPMSAEFLEKYESLGHWCPNGDRVRPYSFAVCSMCMGKGAIQIVQLRGVPREETNHE